MKVALTEDFKKGCIRIVHYTPTGRFSHGGEALDFHYIFNVYPKDKSKYDEFFLQVLKNIK